MNTKPTTTRAEKALPRARAVYASGPSNGSTTIFCNRKHISSSDRNAVLIDCHTRAQAARIARVANMTEGEQVEMVDKIVTHGINRWLAGDKDACSALPGRLLSALGLLNGEELP